jgi:hypothetical protein
MVMLGMTYSPDMEKHRKYRELSARHSALYEAVKNVRDA